MLAVACALGAALLYGLASVLHHRVAAAAPAERSLRPSLLVHVLRQPLWLAGIAADIGGFGLQFIALSRGALVLVQPLLVSGLLFALPIGALTTRRRMQAIDWFGGAAIVVGLSTFLIVANPDRGRPTATTEGWIIVFALAAIPTAALCVLAPRAHGTRRAALLGTAAGTIFALTAALSKATAHLLSHGIGDVITGWEPYALLAIGACGEVVVASAFQAGPLAASLPAVTVVDPVVSIAIGAAAFGEGVNNQGAAPVLEALGLVLLAVGVIALARSPLVTAAGEPEPADSG